MPKSSIKFVKSGRGKARCKPDPDYPNGISLDLSRENEPKCKFDLPYPAPECGYWHISCLDCEKNFVITAAGRVDDPIALTVPCELKKRMQ